jgi:16S rRNA C967 or C1407 C5-methylase (RsmB/RsmF family)/NOL1/NOP2/fmu family ribosome biogenesis protein
MLRPDFTKRLYNIFPAETADALLAAHNDESPVSIRFNTNKTIPALNCNGRVPWCTNAYYLPSRPVFTLDPHFHAGAYYVQEASSMFLEKLFDLIEAKMPLKVLDMSAAPGGKSTHLLSLLSLNDVLISNEIVPSRATILKHNLIKWGHSNAICTNNKPEDFAFLKAYFDVVLVDAPCSGEGLFRKSAESQAEWSPDSVAACARRQKLLLDTILPLVKPGGYLIYSTCTYEPAENDHQIAHILQQGQFEKVDLSFLARQFGIYETVHGLQFMPHIQQGEGFYISLLRNVGEGKSYTKHQNVQKTGKKDKIEFIAAEALSCIKELAGLLIREQEQYKAITFQTQAVLADIQSKLKVIYAGTWVGEKKGRDFIPAPEMALSIHLNNPYSEYELNMEQALQYLKCETPPIHNMPNGWVLIRHEGNALGWAKGLGARWNNYYPKGWRILMHI